MPDTTIDIITVAKLANLSIAPEATSRLQDQLSSILGYVDTLQKIPGSELATAQDMATSTNRYRDDIKADSVPAQTQKRVYKVKRLR